VGRRRCFPQPGAHGAGGQEGAIKALLGAIKHLVSHSRRLTEELIKPASFAQNFINDTIRNDFHKKFINKYVK